MKVAIITYSLYGHITELAKAIKLGVEESGAAAQVDILRLSETLSDDLLEALSAPPKPSDIREVTHADLETYDAFLFGLPTRFGNFPSQFASFWDGTGPLWALGALHGKPVGFFVSTGTVGGGQEITIRNFLPNVVHHGLVYIPLPYGAAPGLFNMDEPRGGSPWGAGTFAGADGSRQPTELELQTARDQGKFFAPTALKIVSARTTNVATSTEATSSDVAETKAETKAEAKAPATTPAKESSKCCVIV